MYSLPADCECLEVMNEEIVRKRSGWSRGRRGKMRGGTSNSQKAHTLLVEVLSTLVTLQTLFEKTQKKLSTEVTEGWSLREREKDGRGNGRGKILCMS